MSTSIDDVAGHDTLEAWLGDEDGRDAITDDVVLAVRRAVASIDTGSLAARRRLVETAGGRHRPRRRSTPAQATLPGRVAVRTDSPEVASPWPAAMSAACRCSTTCRRASRSAPAAPGRPTPGEGDDEGEPHRASALRRLIGSLRRR